MRYHGLLLAAGKGTRLNAEAEGIPKALVKVGGDTLVEQNLNRLVDLGVEHVVVVVGHFADAVIEYLAHSPHRERLEFVRQEEALGTGHAVTAAREVLKSEPFVLCYCDNYTPYRLGPLLAEHERRQNTVTLALFHAEDPTRHGIAQLEGSRIVGLVERPTEPVGDLAFAGMGVFESDIYEAVTQVPRSASGEYYLTDAVMHLIDAGRKVGFDVLSCVRVNVNSPAQLELAWHYALANPRTDG